MARTMNFKNGEPRAAEAEAPEDPEGIEAEGEEDPDERRN
jgi:hypothetical protein